MGKFVSTGVFDRYGGDTISARLFYLIIALVLCWGFGLTAFCANYAVKIGFEPTLLSLLGLIVPFIGAFIAIKCSNPLLSFVGYNMIVVPFGFFLGPVCQVYSPDVVKHAMYLTIACSAFFGLMGVLFPSFFSRIGWVLFVALSLLVVVRLLQLFIPAMDFTWIDYLSAGVFCLYIGFDMYRADSMAKTVDNAVDLCVDFYLDIINLFLSILRALGNSSSSSSSSDGSLLFDGELVNLPVLHHKLE